MYPPLFFFTSQSVHCHFCFSLSAFSPSLLLRHDHHPCFPPLAVSFPPLWSDDYSYKRHLRLQITAVIQTPVLLQLCVVVLWGFLCLGCIAAPQVHSCLSHMMTPLWPSAALSLVIRWRESCSTIVPSLRSCGRRGSQPGSFIYSETAYSSTCIVLLCSNPLPFSCCLHAVCSWHFVFAMMWSLGRVTTQSKGKVPILRLMDWDWLIEIDMNPQVADRLETDSQTLFKGNLNTSNAHQLSAVFLPFFI